MEEKPQLPVSLFESVDDGTESGKMSEELEDSEYLEYLHQPQHLASSADDLIVLQSLQDERDVERQQYEEIHQVHHLLEEFPSVRGASEAADILQCEEHKGGDVHHVADHGELRLGAGLGAGLITSDLLDVLNSGDNEGEGGDEEDQQGEDGEYVGPSAGPGLLHEVPHSTSGQNYNKDDDDDEEEEEEEEEEDIT